ncbi:cytochrome C [Psychromonas sp. MB-3u-54]|uniref:multiheme c-type cytochrome n=1 Tax=Psychromonas sp. MB-3u-54 TaxID=2058319 RepID=UPI000C335B27|nr:multiheme c-type cytochrome [Psychromonas sp. MB-3u-54]PKH02810.1 cytochrome C [Psychromonas sp. MB-3u-54]
MRLLQRSLIFMSLCILCLPGLAAGNKVVSERNILVPAADFEIQVENKAEMEKLIKENRRCIRCHQVERKLKKIPAVTVQGAAHGSEKFYDNCTACHGDKGKHPKQDVSVISFAAHSPTPLAQQNGQCLKCHTPVELRKAEWTHDVHYKKINCASCHKLHDAVDPIINIERKSRIKLCVDCHHSINESQGEL